MWGKYFCLQLFLIDGSVPPWRALMCLQHSRNVLFNGKGGTVFSTCALKKILP